MGDNLVSIKELIWRFALDPFVNVIERRIAHNASMEPITHNGKRWESIANIDGSVRFFQDAILANEGKKNNLTIRANCQIAGGIIVKSSGCFEMGSHCFVGTGSRVWCNDGIRIGTHVLISHLVDVHDSDTHSLDWSIRHTEGNAQFGDGTPLLNVGADSQPVTIEDDAWICFKASILKGVTVGRGAIVAAGSVVTRDVAPYTLVAGNPARPIKDLKR